MRVTIETTPGRPGRAVARIELANGDTLLIVDGPIRIALQAVADYMETEAKRYA